MYKLIPIVSFLLFTFSFNSSEAHQDKIIELNNGKLVGLPDQYQPAYFDLEKKSLQIGTNRIIFPPCVTTYFPNSEKYKLLITSSWYHSSELLPPYIVFHIRPQNRDYNYELVFELDTLKPYHFLIHAKKSNSVSAMNKIEINESCEKSIATSILKVTN